MIPDRLIEHGTLTTDGSRVSVEVRIPWYRALPASCIGPASLAVDGVAVPPESLRWTMNGRVFTFAEMVDDTDEWWFPVDSAELSGDLALAADGSEHEVEVGLTLWLPYLIVDEEVLHIEEHDAKRMPAQHREAVAR